MATVTVYPSNWNYALGNTRGLNNPEYLYQEANTSSTYRPSEAPVTLTWRFDGFDFSAIPSGATINSVTMETITTFTRVRDTSNNSITLSAGTGTTLLGSSYSLEIKPTVTYLLKYTKSLNLSLYQLNNLFVHLAIFREGYDYGSFQISYIRFVVDYSESTNVSTTAVVETASATIKPPSVLISIDGEVAASLMSGSATLNSPLVNTTRSTDLIVPSLLGNVIETAPTLITGYGTNSLAPPIDAAATIHSPLVNTERSATVETETISVSSDIVLPYVETGEGGAIHVFPATAEVHDTSPIVATSTTTTHSVFSAHTTQSTNDVLAERNPTIISSAAIAQVSESQPIVDATAEVGVPLLTATAEAKTSISVSFGSTIVTTTEATVVHNTQPTVTAQRHTEVSVELSNQSAVIIPPAVAVAAIAIVNSMAIEGKTNNPTIHTVAHTLITSTTETANAVLFSPVLDIWTRATRIILAHLSYKEASCIVSAKEAVATVSTAERKSPISISERDAKIKSTERVSAIEVR